MNREIFSAVQVKFDALKGEIEQGAYKGYKGLSPTDGWGGAGIGFSTVPVDLGEPGCYPDPRIVVTPHAYAAGWLLDRLRDIFFEAGLIDSCSKIEFFGRLARAAQRYQTAVNGRSETVEGLLRAMLGEASQILVEMQQGAFNSLVVAVGNEIAAEHAGYHIDENHARYFAYGSNMEVQQMNERCPEAVLIGKARLTDYRFIINTRGVATVIPADGHTVHGLVWQINREHEARLDKEEGVRKGHYTKQCMSVICDDGAPEIVLVYVATVVDVGDIAREGYLEKIVKSLYSHAMPVEYIDEVKSLTGSAG